MGYPLFIGGSGYIFVSKRWTHQLPGAHCKQGHMNYRSLGVALLGDFGGKRKEKGRWEQPTIDQILSLLSISVFAHKTFGWDPSPDRIKGHYDYAPKSCPGFLFKDNDPAWKEALAEATSHLLKRQSLSGRDFYSYFVSILHQ